MRGRTSQWIAAHATVFVASFCVMVVELVAGRIISRHLGASIYTWTSVIGVILGGLALGNWAGGRLADRYPPRPTLGLLFLASALTCVTTVVANNVVGGWHALWDLSWPARVATHVALVFGLPAAVLGTISPVVARMALSLGHRTGRTLGSVYAWGVVGSLVGTFATGYVLIDRLGTGAIVWGVAGLLAVVGLLHLPLSPRAWATGGLVLASTLLAHNGSSFCRAWGERLYLRGAPDPGVIYADESLYSHIEVRRLDRDDDVRGMYLDKLLHSQLSMSDPIALRYDYARIFAELTDRHEGVGRPLTTLTIGGGGYVFPRYLEATRPGSRVEVVEIDPAVTRAAIEAFGLPRDTTIATHNVDGRVFVNRRVDRRARGEAVPDYDAIYLDAVNDYSVPFQLTTLEFFRATASLLAPRGVLLVNCIDVLDSGSFVGSLVRTLEEVLPHVEVYTLGNYSRLRGDSRLTFVIAASSEATEWHASDARSAGVARLDGTAVGRYRAAGRTLTDGYAPVETLIAPVVLASAQEIAAQESLRLALRLEKRGDAEGFRRYSREAATRDPELPEAHYNLGIALYRAGATDQAIEHWTRALRLDPGYAEAHFNLGAALYARGELPAALAHLLEAARLRPGLAAAQNAAGIVLEAQGDLDGARQRFGEALRLDPDLAEARRNLARVEAAL